MSIIFKDIIKSYNGNIIFKGISGQINDGDKVGIIGVNGVGKTTLIRIIMGLEEYDSGKLHKFPGNMKFGYLKQLNDYDEETTVRDLLDRIALGNTTFTNSSGYGRRLKNSVLAQGFRDKDMNKRVVKLSGGEKTRIALCIALGDDPDVLVLDEPTNHLDIEAIAWLEGFVRDIKKTVIIISHDRQFLDNTTNKIFEMKQEGIEEYTGNYSNYKYQRDTKMKYLLKENKKQERTIKNIKRTMDERRAWFEKAHKHSHSDGCWGDVFKRKRAEKHVEVLKEKQRQLNRLMKRRVVVPKIDLCPGFGAINKDIFDEKLPQYILKVTRLCMSYGGKEIIRNLSFTVKSGDRIVLMGRNGCGKTTLIKLLLGLERAISGSVNMNPSVIPGYFSQELEGLNPQNTVIDELVQDGCDRLKARTMLGRFLFSGEDIYKYVANLSMGEKCRVVFAKMLMEDRNLLILDEPTNHMDIASRESVEEVLAQYKGTMILVTHDRYLAKRLATRVFEMEDHTVRIYEGGYEYYIDKKKEERMKARVGSNYDMTRDEITRLECELAFLSGRLGSKWIDDGLKKEVEMNFFDIVKKLDELKSSIGFKS